MIPPCTGMTNRFVAAVRSGISTCSLRSASSCGSALAPWKPLCIRMARRSRSPPHPLRSLARDRHQDAPITHPSTSSPAQQPPSSSSLFSSLITRSPSNQPLSSGLITSSPEQHAAPQQHAAPIKRQRGLPKPISEDERRLSASRLAVALFLPRLFFRFFDMAHHPLAPLHLPLSQLIALTRIGITARSQLDTNRRAVEC